MDDLIICLPYGESICGSTNGNTKYVCVNNKCYTFVLQFTPTY